MKAILIQKIMLPPETLKRHYEEYASQTHEWVDNMGRTKSSIVEHVLRETKFEINGAPIRVLVLGASDQRYIAIHQEVFNAAIQRTVEMTTFDIEPEHLGGESQQVVSHDVTRPFPHAPYTLIFSHELMKFLTPQEQLTTIKNSHEALGENCLAMHIMHEPSVKGTSELRDWQHRTDPDELIKQLEAEGIFATKLTFASESNVDWLRETTVIVLQKGITEAYPVLDRGDFANKAAFHVK
jgi:hypothetical protein